MAKSTNNKATTNDSSGSKTRRSNKGKGRRNIRKGYVKETDKIAGQEQSSTNDPSWYSMSPELLRDAASIPFSWPTGTDLHQANTSTPGYHDFINNETIAGAAVMELKPIVGTSTDANSPVNVASSAIYSFVRHANSGHSNYDAPNLMMYILAMAHVYSFITWCQRLLGLIMAFDQRNRYMPDSIIRALGVSPNSLRANISNFRFWLNNLINKVASFAVPATMPYFSRLAFLYSNYYIEGASIKDQIYMYKPYNNEFLKFSLNSQSRGQLTYEAIPTNSDGLSEVSHIMQFGNDLFDAIWGEEDFGIMSGDILKAYGGNIIKLSTVPEDFILTPVYDTTFLHQFKNAKLCRNLDFSVIQDDGNGNIIQTVMIDSSSPADVAKACGWCYNANKILSSDFDEPTPEVVIESTRLMPAWDSQKLWIVGSTEIPLLVKYVYEPSTSDLSHHTQNVTIFDWTTSTDSQAFWNMVNVVACLKQFKYAPEFWAGIVDNTGFQGVARVWEVDNYAVLNNDDLIKMHQTALMSMLAVPSIAKIQ